jgi:hypothetical protein
VWWALAEGLEVEQQGAPKGTTLEAVGGLTNEEIDVWIEQNWPDTAKQPPEPETAELIDWPVK